jgi:hypothetical protein
LAISWQLWLGIGSYTFDVFGIGPRYPAEAIPCGFGIRSKINFIDPLDRTGAIDRAKEKGRKGNRAPSICFFAKAAAIHCCRPLA